jgi:5'-methylthioadenosine phosphorylase
VDRPPRTRPPATLASLAAELGIGTITLAYVTDNDSAPSENVSADLVFARLRAAQPRIVNAIDRTLSAIPLDYQPRELIGAEHVDGVLGRVSA